MLAKAKINLSLHVTGKRADGYHTLQSLVMFADVGDELTLAEKVQEPHHISLSDPHPTPLPSRQREASERAGEGARHYHDDFALHIGGPYANVLANEVPMNNLVSRAAVALAKRAGVSLNISLSLAKKLPIGAGLGGGSADAAATLHLLNAHWQLGYSSVQLESIGALLGSDIPACVYAKPLWIEAAGEKITPCEIPFDIPVLLVNPSIHVATKDVYARIMPPYETLRDLPAKFADYPSLLAFLHNTRNHLQDAAIEIAPEIHSLLDDMETLHGCRLARMSGSGSTCFALFDRKTDCDKAAAMLYSRHSGYWIQSTVLLGSHHG